jgi:hypothetical protein
VLLYPYTLLLCILGRRTWSLDEMWIQLDDSDLDNGQPPRDPDSPAVVRALRLHIRQRHLPCFPIDLTRYLTQSISTYKIEKLTLTAAFELNCRMYAGMSRT